MAQIRRGEERRVYLVLSDCCAYGDILYTSNHLELLTSNTTENLQPCDKGLREIIKTHYGLEMRRQAIYCFDEITTFYFNLLEALRIFHTD